MKTKSELSTWAGAARRWVGLNRRGAVGVRKKSYRCRNHGHPVAAVSLSLCALRTCGITDEYGYVGGTTIRILAKVRYNVVTIAGTGSALLLSLAVLLAREDQLANQRTGTLILLLACCLLACGVLVRQLSGPGSRMGPELWSTSRALTNDCIILNNIDTRRLREMTRRGLSVAG